MKVKLEIDDEASARLYMAAPKMHSVLYEWFQTLRNNVKFGETQDTTWEEVQRSFLDVLAESNLDIFEM